MDPNFEIAFVERKKQLNRKITALIESGAHIQQLVEILNAQEYLRYERKGRQEPVTVLDIRAFVEDEAKKLNATILPDSMAQINDVILPPGQGEIITGSGAGFEEREKIPRCRYLIDVLTELNIHYSVVSGKVDKKMVRNGSYQLFLIPEKQKIIFVNDEHDNATFVVHQVEDTEEWKELSQMTKEELKGSTEGKRTSTVNWQANPQYWKNRIKEILSIDLPIEKSVDALRNNKDGQYEYAPDGWLTNFGLAKKNKKSKQSVALLANKYRKEHPEWFKMYLDDGAVFEHLHPDLVKSIEKEMAVYEKAPPGWLTRNGLTERTMGNDRKIKYVANKYRAGHPDWFKMYLDDGAKISEHFHPDLIAQIKKELQS